MSRFQQLEKLAAEIATKAKGSADTSYTAKLVAAGIEKCAKKFGEESFELAIAAVSPNDKHTTAEAADVLYHLLVLLEARGIAIEHVMAELKRREGISGLDEKASRSKT